MNPNFLKSLPIVDGVEKGYVNDPNDPGGRTIYGCTERDNPDLWANGPPAREACEQRFYERYWLPAKCDDLPWPLCMLVFDCAVNQGPPTAVKLLQKAAGTTQDGIIGKNSLVAITKADQSELCALFMADRALRYTGTRNFDVYGRGWFKRLFKISMGV